MRADVNVSVRPKGSTELKTRVEVKNVNSVKFVMQAIEVEAERQVGVWEDGGEVIQETRLFDPNKGETRAMRSKEFAHDYRYFPDPDLLPVRLDEDFIANIEATLPELPDEKKARLIADMGLSAYDAGVLVSDRETAAYFEEAAAGHDAKQVANWLTTNLFGALNKRGLDIAESPVSAAHLGALVGLIEDGTISSKIAKDVFEIMLETSKAPAAIVAEKGLKQITDTGAIEAIVDKAIADNPGQADDVRGGNDKAIGWFVGQVMKASQGKANPGQVNELLRKKLLG